MRAYVKLPPNSGHLSITDNFFKSRRCPLFRAFAVPEILNFSGKQWQRNNFFRPIGVLTSLSVIIFSVTLRDRGQIFLKKAAIHENDMTQFFFVFSTRIKCEERKECDMKKYLFSVTLQYKLNMWLDKCLLTSNSYFTYIND